jgi:hypothetical protein
MRVGLEGDGKESKETVGTEMVGPLWSEVHSGNVGRSKGKAHKKGQGESTREHAGDLEEEGKEPSSRP